MKHRRSAVAILTAAAFALAFEGCDKNPNPGAPSPPSSPGAPAPVVLRFEVINPGSIPPGESVQLTSRVIKSDGSTEDVTARTTWRSFDTKVLEVSSTGLVRAVALGEATIGADYTGRFQPVHILVLPAETFRLTGRVTESGFGLANVTIAVLSGIGNGLRTETNVSGEYRLYGVRGSIRLRASKDGYAETTRTLDVSDHRTFDFDLAAGRDRIDLRGAYVMTVTANCRVTGQGQLPAEARTRRYTASVAQDGALLTVTLSGAEFIETRGRGNHFSGLVEPGGDVVFTLGDPYYYYYETTEQYDVVERFTPTSALALSGIITGRAAGSTITGTLNGAFLLASGTSAPFHEYSAYCIGDHPFELRR